MPGIHTLIDYVLHVDRHLGVLIHDYGAWTYAILFLIIFLETGLVVTPFLPGDSLLFATGALAAVGELSIPLLWLLLSAAAVLGDSANYYIGSRLSEPVLQGRVRFVKRQHLERTHEFFEKYGGKTILLARFVPIVRTYAPFVAGAGRMHYARFLAFNLSGGVLWVSLFLLGGYFFGNIRLVKENFGLVVIGIIVVSVLPAVYELARHRLAAARLAPAHRPAPAGAQPTARKVTSWRWRDSSVASRSRRRARRACPCPRT